MYMSDKDIDNRVKEHLDYVLENTPKYDWFVIGAVGSMNYGLMTDNSDIDTKFIIIPNLKDITFNKKRVSRTILVPSDSNIIEEHCDIKDAREYFNIFKKMNINFVELLFTDYWIANPKYNDIWFTLRQHAEDLARLNPCSAVIVAKGMAYSKLSSMIKRRQEANNIEDTYNDFKDLSHILRLSIFMKYYTEKKPYAKCLYPDDYFTNWVRGCKNGQWIITPEERLEHANCYFEQLSETASDFLNSYSIKENNKQIEQILDDCLYELISRKLKGELCE